jgi:hypothetical protein
VSNDADSFHSPTVLPSIGNVVNENRCCVEFATHQARYPINIVHVTLVAKENAHGKLDTTQTRLPLERSGSW